MFAIPASYDNHEPTVTVSAKKGTYVHIRTQISSATHYINDYSSHIFFIHDDELRVTNGVENKGIEVTSDEPVSVHIGTLYQYSYRIPDDIMVRPITADDTEYIISSYPGTSSGSSSTYLPNSYFMIIPQFDESLVEVFSFENDIWVQQYSVVLDKFEVFTLDYYYVRDGNEDYTGWRVVATQPVAVISGHGYAYFGSQRQHTCDAMPSIADMGVHYVTFPVLFGIGTEQYVVRIVGSTTEDINVVIPDVEMDEIIPRGSFLEVERLDSYSLMMVSSPVFRLGLYMIQNYSEYSDPCYFVQLKKVIFLK